ncbi:MAG TPA: SDR family oxidoreductase [Planctomycetota bacterium]|nr:SDR family oxidoreductase [Planctomycetota bacterium]
MKALIIGASGQVGGLLLRQLCEKQWECLGTGFKHAQGELLQLDTRDSAAVLKTATHFRPDVIFLPGALTFVDYCETHADECYAINVDGTANVACAAKQLGVPVVFFSTEHVFSDSPDAYPEDAQPAAKSVYAKSKVLAESRLREILPDQHLILRASWVFGPETQRKNFVYRAVKTLRERQPLKIPSDQWGQPTYSVDLAETAVRLLERSACGTFHTVGPEHLTRPQFAGLIARMFDLPAATIETIPTAELGQPAPRPLFIKLRRDKLLITLGCDSIRSPEAALAAMRDGPEAFRP